MKFYTINTVATSTYSGNMEYWYYASCGIIPVFQNQKLLFQVYFFRHFQNVTLVSVCFAFMAKPLHQLQWNLAKRYLHSWKRTKAAKPLKLVHVYKIVWFKCFIRNNLCEDWRIGLINSICIITYVNSS